MASLPDITSDTFFNGRLTVKQSRNGYRFSIDAVLLADSIVLKPGQSILELGTGCGIIPLILASKYPDVIIQAIEVQDALYRLARINVDANGFRDKIRLICKDVKKLNSNDIRSPFDWVVSNPPYRHAMSGRINPDSQKALARHEIALNLDQLIQVGKRWLKTRGRMAVIYPAQRMADVLIQMRQAGIEPKWMRCIHSLENDPAQLVIVHGVNMGRPGLTIAEPLIIYRTDGTYTPTIHAMMEQ